jgi:uncharacterized OsmC-like protein
MSEKVIVRQNDKFEIEFKAVLDPEAEDGEVEPVAHLHALTPYGMLLASLGSCTTILLQSYARHHEITLPWVEIEAVYQHPSEEGAEGDQERIMKTLRLPEDVGGEMRERLHKISHRCSIQALLHQGIEVISRLDETESA